MAKLKSATAGRSRCGSVRSEAEEVTAGGIVLPDAAKEKPQRGKVIAAGPGKLLDSGNRGELSVKIGDEVIFGKYGGSEVEVDGEESQDPPRERHPRQSRQLTSIGQQRPATNASTRLLK